MAPFAAASVAVERLAPAGGLATFLAQVAATLPAALVGAWLIALTPAERDAARELLRGALASALRLFQAAPAERGG
jgi:hypothetical protein